MRTHNTEVVSSIPPCVTFKTPLVRKASGNHLMNSTSLENTQSAISGFCYARNRVCNAVLFLINEEGVPGLAMVCFWNKMYHWWYVNIDNDIDNGENDYDMNDNNNNNDSNYNGNEKYS